MKVLELKEADFLLFSHRGNNPFTLRAFTEWIVLKVNSLQRPMAFFFRANFGVQVTKMEQFALWRCQL